VRGVAVHPRALEPGSRNCIWRGGSLELELELIPTQMAQKPMLQAEVYARALRASQNVKRAEVWVGARCASWVGGAWASAGVEGAHMGWRDL
jgi:hypothetical protein